MHRKKLINKLDFAEIQYKLALAVSSTCQSQQKSVISYLEMFSFGKHTVDKTELILDKNQEELASVLLEHSATYITMVQLNSVLEEVWPNRLQHKNDNIRNASQITRLIRNAFAHDPFEPIWKITPRWDNHIFEVK